jgi:hypothetical protein
MFTLNTITAEFKSLVGFKEENDITLSRQTSGLLTVGKTYKILTFVTGDNFLNVGALSNATGVTFTATGTTPTTWTHGSTLQDQQYVTSDSGLYVNDLPIKLEDINKSLFITSGLVPEKTITQYISDIYNVEVQNVVNRFIRKSKEQLKNKEILKNFDTIRTQDYDLKSQGANFVGYIIKLKDSITINCIIEALQLQLKEADSVKIYLYRLDKQVAIKTYDFVYSTAKDSQLQAMTDWILEYKDETTSSITYLLGYYEYNSSNPLASQLSATNENFEYNDDFFWMQKHLSNYLYISPIKLPSTCHNYNAISGVYDLPTNIYDYLDFESNSTSLHLRLKLVSDYTDLIVNHSDYFAELLQYVLALRITNDCISTKTFNQVTETQLQNWKNLALMLENKINGYNFTDANGNKGHYMGLLEQLIADFEGSDEFIFKKRDLLSIY